MLYDQHAQAGFPSSHLTNVQNHLSRETHLLSHPFQATDNQSKFFPPVQLPKLPPSPIPVRPSQMPSNARDAIG